MIGRIAPLAVLCVACVHAQGDQNVVDASAIRRTAFELEAKGDHSAAADRFVELAEVESSNPNWLLRAGENLGKAGRYNDAMDLLDAASKRFPTVPELLVLLAQTYHMKADAMIAEGIRDINVTFYYEDVSRTAQRILDMHPTHRKAKLLHASAKFQLGQLDEALAIAEQLVVDHPKDYGAFALLGKVSLQQFVNEKQRFDYEQPRGTGRSQRLADLKRVSDRAEQALAYAASLDPERSYPVIKLGDIDAWNGDLEAAMIHYRDGLTIDPGTTAIDHNWLRSSLTAEQRLEMYGGALTDYRAKPNTTGPKAAILVWYVAQANYDASNWKQAKQGFEQALAARQDFVRTYYYLVQSSFWSGAEDDAAAYALTFAEKAPRVFADMIRSDEQAKALVRGIAQSSYKANRYVQSRELNHVLALAANGVDEWNNYAFLCRETGAYEKSFDAYERALAIEESPQLLNDAAVILQYHLRTEANLETARSYYERAIELAQSMLEDDLDQTVRQRVRTALRDARNNLARL